MFSRIIKGTLARKHNFKLKKDVLKSNNVLKASDILCGNKSLTGLSVGIIGAGLAGTYSGNLLTELGCQVTIYEASDRIGGRTFTKNMNGRLVEFGGEFIGMNHPRLLELNKRYKLGLRTYIGYLEYEAQDLTYPVTFDGVQLSDETITKIEEEIDVILVKFGNDADKITDASRPWLEKQSIKKWDRISLSQRLTQLGLKSSLTRRYLEYMLANDCGGPCTKISYLWYLCQIKGELRYAYDSYEIAEVFCCEQGNDSFAKNLAQNLNIKYKTFVNKINLQGNKVVVNDSFIHDVVILTTPATIYKDISFDSNFNVNKYIPSYGGGIKFISQHNNRFWISDHRNPELVDNSIGVTWEATTNQSAPIPSSQNIYMTCFSTNEINDVDMEFYKKECQNNYSEFNDSLVSIEKVNWSNNPYTKAGYSYGQPFSLTVYENLNTPAPEYNNRLLFAGEHVSTSFAGYMEGALQSAERAVINITKNFQ